VIAVAAIVEGAGEVAALPILLRRINAWRTPDVHLQALPPIRVHRDRFLNRDDEFRRHLLLAAAKCGEQGWILVLLDADDDCPAELGKQILERATAYVPHHRVSVVLANREYEAWFIAAAESLAGQRGFAFKPAEAIDAEGPRNAKGCIKAHRCGGSYGETTDQPAFSARRDLQQAFARSRSFRKLCSEWARQMAFALTGAMRPRSWVPRLDSLRSCSDVSTSSAPKARFVYPEATACSAFAQEDAGDLGHCVRRCPRECQIRPWRCRCAASHRLEWEAAAPPACRSAK
jgi:hypothetical protein